MNDVDDITNFTGGEAAIRLNLNKKQQIKKVTMAQKMLN